LVPQYWGFPGSLKAFLRENGADGHGVEKKFLMALGSPGEGLRIVGNTSSAIDNLGEIPAGSHSSYLDVDTITQCVVTRGDHEFEQLDLAQIPVWTGYCALVCFWVGFRLIWACLVY
jgi:hypothetical protein